MISMYLHLQHHAGAEGIGVAKMVKSFGLMAKIINYLTFFIKKR